MKILLNSATISQKLHVTFKTNETKRQTVVLTVQKLNNVYSSNGTNVQNTN